MYFAIHFPVGIIKKVETNIPAKKAQFTVMITPQITWFTSFFDIFNTVAHGRIFMYMYVFFQHFRLVMYKENRSK